MKKSSSRQSLFFSMYTKCSIIFSWLIAESSLWISAIVLIISLGFSFLIPNLVKNSLFSISVQSSGKVFLSIRSKSSVKLYSFLSPPRLKKIFAFPSVDKSLPSVVLKIFNFLRFLQNSSLSPCWRLRKLPLICIYKLWNHSLSSMWPLTHSSLSKHFIKWSLDESSTSSDCSK